VQLLEARPPASVLPKGAIGCSRLCHPPRPLTSGRIGLGATSIGWSWVVGAAGCIAFATALRTPFGLQEDLSDALTGHSGGRVGRQYGARARHPSQRHKVIVERYGMPRVVEAISAVRFPTINLEAVRWRAVGRNACQPPRR
jgi:hypothetical protein